MKEKQTNSQLLISLLNDLPDFCTNIFIGRKAERVLNTRLGYARDLKKFFEFLIDTHPYFCEMKVKQIQPSDMKEVSAEDLDKYIELFSDEHEIKTVARMKSSISAMYTYLINTLQVIQYNPVLGTQKVKIPPKDYVVYLNLEEQERLLQTIRYGTGLSERQKKWHTRYIKRDLAMVFLFLDTGMRVSELQGADNNDVDLNECSIIVRRKGGKLSKIYFSDESAEYLRDYMEEKKQLYPLYAGFKDPLIISEKGERLSVRQYENIVPKYVQAAIPEKAGLINCHKLRSSFAMEFYMRDPEYGGHDILALQQRMNHQSLTSTNVYAKAAQNVSKETRNWRNTQNTPAH